MIRRPPRSTLDRSSAASDVYKRQELVTAGGRVLSVTAFGKDTEHAILNAYASASLIDFEGKTNRTDIGHDLLRATAGKGGGAKMAIK